MFLIKRILTEVYQENVWIIIDPKSKKAIIIDPGEVEIVKFVEIFENEKITPVAIINTHSHPDHIASVTKLQKKYNIPFFLHELEKEGVTNLPMLASAIGFSNLEVPENIKYINDDTFEYEDFQFKIIHTPGHTPGSICIKIDKNLFSGDTLFLQSVGRTDLPGGSIEDMNESLKLFKQMEHDIYVYPGHGPQTSIGNEIKRNPFF